jgi:hypothetical protein
MPKHYCHRCAINRGVIVPCNPTTLSGNQYQLDKYLKHTAPTSAYPINGIFDDPSYNTYKDYVITTLASGTVSQQDNGRINMNWIAGSRIGVQIENGKPILDTDTITVVFADDDSRIHAFPTRSDKIRMENCCICGIPIISGGY